MNEATARKLKVGHRVAWLSIRQTLYGTVKDVKHFGVLIRWDDGEDGWIDYRDFQNVYHADPKAAP